ncbi:MAG: hypothetical protein FWE06_08720 [Oscillospiraceae bacterium]|nr:hypothetical protein [Oscillospiraceae bacterium]
MITKLIGAAGINDIVKLGLDLTAKKVEERSTRIEVAEVYSSDYRLKLQDAKRWLEEDGLRVEPVVPQPDIAYKDCSEYEVVATNFKLKQKVAPGTRVILRYVTAEVIEASQKLFDEMENQKAGKSTEMTEERTGRIKQNLNEKVESVKKVFTKISRT